MVGDWEPTAMAAIDWGPASSNAMSAVSLVIATMR